MIYFEREREIQRGRERDREERERGRGTNNAEINSVKQIDIQLRTL